MGLTIKSQFKMFSDFDISSVKTMLNYLKIMREKNDDKITIMLDDSNSR